MANRTQVASIHSHFNIFRDVHDAHEGEVTIGEQIKALQRFVRWHERQVCVGKELLARLVKATVEAKAQEAVKETVEQ